MSIGFTNALGSEETERAILAWPAEAMTSGRPLLDEARQALSAPMRPSDDGVWLRCRRSGPRDPAAVLGEPGYRGRG